MGLKFASSWHNTSLKITIFTKSVHYSIQEFWWNLIFFLNLYRTIIISKTWTPCKIYCYNFLSTLRSGLCWLGWRWPLLLDPQDSISERSDLLRSTLLLAWPGLAALSWARNTRHNLSTGGQLSILVVISLYQMY